MYLQEQAFASGQLDFELGPIELLLESPPKLGLIVLPEWKQEPIVLPESTQGLMLLPETERQLSLLAPTPQQTIARRKKESPLNSAIDLVQL